MHNGPMRTFFLLTLATLTGCASISNLQMADTLGRGNFQFGIEPGVLGAQSLRPGAAASESGYFPHVDVSARYGVSEGVDVGVRAGLSFIELQGKFLFTRPGDPHLAVSLAPTVGGLVLGGGGSAAGIINIGVPVLVGIKTAGGSELVLGPRLQNLVAFGTVGSGTGGAIYGLAAGGSVGFAWRITDNFGLMPEASVVLPVLGGSAFASQFTSVSSVNAGAAIIQVKIGVLIGRFRPLKPPNDDLQQAPPQRIPVVANPPLPAPLPAPDDGPMTPPPPPPPSP